MKPATLAFAPITWPALLLGLVALLPSLGLCGKAPLVVGDQAPNWVLQDTHGHPHALYDQAEAGKTTVMLFWASWCEHCKRLIPELQTHEQTLTQHQVSVYLLHLWEEKPAEALDTLNPTAYPVLLKAGAVARRFGVNTTPGLVVVGPDKTILYRREPGHAPDSLIEEVMSALKKQEKIQAKSKAPDTKTPTKAPDPQI